jgi:hypothetical protein
MDFQQHNLVAFGCSFTYGHGLKDCIGDDNWMAGPKPSTYSWPTYVHHHLETKSLVNRGKPGASNKLIAKRIIDFKFQDPSIVVVQWTRLSRKTIFKDSENKLHLLANYVPKGNIPKIWWDWHGVNRDDYHKLIKQYYENFHYDYDAYFDFCLTVGYINQYLKDRGIKSYHLFESEDLNTFKQTFNHMKPKDIQATGFNYKRDFHIDDALDTAKGNPHPGHKSHRHFARFIEGWIRKCD